MTTNTNPFSHLTPADVEYVPVTDIALGDVLVSGFHNTTTDRGDTPPTMRKLKRALFTRVNTIDHARTPRQHAIIEFNINDASARTTVLINNPMSRAITNVWRVKREAI